MKVTKAARCCLISVILLAAVPAGADSIAIIGTGQVAGALGPEFAAQGHVVVYGSRNPDRDDVRELVARTGPGSDAKLPPQAAAGADIIVLAVPGMLVEQITESLGNLDGKIIIDPTNPLKRNEDGSFEMAVATSNGELIQAAAPGAYVVKAFNALNWATMVDPESSGGPVSIPLVGDNEEAKIVVADLVAGMGLDPIDVGPLRHSRFVEGMLILWINNRYAGGQPFDYHLRKTSQD